MVETQAIRFGEVVFDLYHDPTYIPDCVVAQLPKDELEPELSHLLVRACRPGDVVVDAGANIGYFTLMMSRLVGPAGFVHAFEPHPDTARRLDANVLLNRAGNVLIHEVALWDCPRDLTLYTCWEPGLASLRPFIGWTGSRTVRAARLDSMLLTTPRLIKMDVEGSELTALRGSDKFLADVPFVVCELSRTNLGYHGTSPEAVATYMRGFGRSLWSLHKNDSPPTLVPPGGEWLGAINQVGLFATSEAVEELWP